MESSNFHMSSRQILVVSLSLLVLYLGLVTAEKEPIDVESIQPEDLQHVSGKIIYINE